MEELEDKCTFFHYREVKNIKNLNSICVLVNLFDKFMEN